MSQIINHLSEKPMTAKDAAELMFGQIRMDIGLWEYNHGDPPGKIFMSRSLYDLIRNYNARMIHNYPNPRIVKMFGIPVEPYYPEEEGALEYHLADGGKKLNWKDV